MRIVVFALCLSACVRSDEKVSEPHIPVSCTGLISTFDMRTAPRKFPVELHAEVSNANRDLLERAIVAWENVVGGELFVFTDRTSGCDFTTITDSAVLPDFAVGLTGFGYCGVDDVTFLHRLNPGQYSPSWYTTDVTLAIIEHELGHVLGLGHETDDSTSIMYPKIVGGQELSARSICAARFSYERFGK